MTLELANMLERIERRQWAVEDIDWAAPGADRITDAQRPKLKAFMTDLVWIEHVGARAFKGLAAKAGDSTLAQIYRYFEIEEQRHAAAELALMRRWGMLEESEIPEPDINIRFAMFWLDRYADALPMSILGSVIPMLEVALDGALVKFLLDQVADPLCHSVFEKINHDEARHLAVDFHVLEMLGRASGRRHAVGTVWRALQPSVISGALMYIPLLSKIRDNIVDMGLDVERLHAAVDRYSKLGDRSRDTRRNPAYQILKQHAQMVVDPHHPYQLLAGALVTASGLYPRALLPPQPAWARRLATTGKMAAP